MIINPNTALQQGWVKFPEGTNPAFIKKCVQQAAIDIPVTTIRAVSARDMCIITEDERRLATTTVVEPDSEGHVILEPGVMYDFESSVSINVPPAATALMQIRSSFSRCGARLSTGLWDPGFKGNAGASIILHGPPIKIKLGTRFAQVWFVKTDSAGQYEGRYQQQSQHWSNQMPQHQPQQPVMAIPPQTEFETIVNNPVSISGEPTKQSFI